MSTNTNTIMDAKAFWAEVERRMRPILDHLARAALAGSTSATEALQFGFAVLGQAVYCGADAGTYAVPEPFMGQTRAYLDEMEQLFPSSVNGPRGAA